MPLSSAVAAVFAAAVLAAGVACAVRVVVMIAARLGIIAERAVKQRLQLLGIPAERIEAVSFGREKPVAYGHSEEAWAQNRRADIVYPTAQ